MKIFNIKIGFFTNHSCSGVVYYYFLVKEYVKKEDLKYCVRAGDLCETDSTDISYKPPVEITGKYYGEMTINPLDFLNSRSDKNEILAKLSDEVYNILEIRHAEDNWENDVGDYIGRLVNISDEYAQQIIKKLKLRYPSMELIGSGSGTWGG